jgi:hypothetical protein
MTGVEEDDFALRCRQRGTPLPWNLAQRRWRVASCACTFAVLVLSTGPVVAFPTLEPWLIARQVFRGPQQAESLSQVYNLGLGLGAVLALPIGLCYDVFGPRDTASIGACIGGIGLLLMGLAVLSTWSSVLYVAYPMAQVGGWMASYGVFPWAWVLPEHQNLLNALPVDTASSALASFGVWLHRWAGLELEYFLFALAGLSAASSLACRYIVPTAQQTACMAASLIEDGEAAEEGMMRGQDGKDCDVLISIRGGGERGEERENCDKESPSERAWEVLALSSQVARLHPAATSLCFAYYTSFALFVSYVMMHQHSYYQAILTEKEAESLVTAFGAIYGGVGAAFSVGLGALADAIGLVRFTLLVNLLLIPATWNLLTPSYSCQWLSMGFISLAMNAYWTGVTRVAMLYAPPALFGACSGAMMSFLGLSQLILIPPIRLWCNAHLEGPGRFTKPYAGLALCAGATGMLLSGYWAWAKPPPQAGGVLLGAAAGARRARDD